jgi:hypothetical protein
MFELPADLRSFWSGVQPPKISASTQVSAEQAGARMAMRLSQDDCREREIGM